MPVIDQAVDKQSVIYRLRHSLAHVMAQAVQNLFPGVKLGFGPPIDDGFYYDFLFPDGATVSLDVFCSISYEATASSPAAHRSWARPSARPSPISSTGCWRVRRRGGIRPRSPLTRTAGSPDAKTTRVPGSRVDAGHEPRGQRSRRRAVPAALPPMVSIFGCRKSICTRFRTSSARGCARDRRSRRRAHRRGCGGPSTSSRPATHRTGTRRRR